MNNKNLLLLDKLITLTKEHKLNWEIYEQSDLKLNLDNESLFNTSLSTMFISHTTTPIYSRSYITQFNKGYIALLAYTYMALSNHVELVLQADSNSFSNTIVTSSNEDVEISSKVKRLYNLIDLDTDRSNVSAYIDEILND